MLQEVAQEAAVAPEREASRYIRMTVAGLTSMHLVHVQRLRMATTRRPVLSAQSSGKGLTM